MHWRDESRTLCTVRMVNLDALTGRITRSLIKGVAEHCARAIEEVERSRGGGAGESESPLPAVFFLCFQCGVPCETHAFAEYAPSVHSPPC